MKLKMTMRIRRRQSDPARSSLPACGGARSRISRERRGLDGESEASTPLPIPPPQGGRGTRGQPPAQTTLSQPEPFGVYVHWPFCRAKCPYCDFNSHVRHGGVDQGRFVRAFTAEIAATASRIPG